MDWEECGPLARWLAVELSATVFGNKPSTIVCIRNLKYCPLLNLWKRYGETFFLDASIQALVLRSTQDTEIVLFYRKELLKKCLRRRSSRDFLERRGYPVQQGLPAVLEMLRSRFTKGCPHEIGIILGIPLKDVVGFMEVRCPHGLEGPWKIYGHVEGSLRLMRCFAHDRACMQNVVENLHTPWQVFRYQPRELLKLRTTA